MSTWQVFMNDVRVGTLADDRYEAICDDVRSRKLLYIKQAFNWLLCALELCIRVTVTSLAVMILVTGHMVASNGMDASLWASYTANPLSLIGTWYSTSFTLGILGLVLVPVFYFDRRMGFRNLFEDQIALCIRQELALPYPGSVVLKREPLTSQTPTEAAKEEKNPS
ncbi:hypothetical protein [Pseudomonas serbica]|jgi:hypothetical protein|uniref:hypothetical protein n=1 Tax=Pseudomonas serbica TaxID=2965074 RepID=UPI00237A6B5E|nr:hypothetical protein [Pseudomonas serbica]